MYESSIANTYDILVVGMGPVGMTCAKWLALKGWNIGIIEKRASLFSFPRAIHMDDEIVRILTKIFDRQSILELLKPVSGMRLKDKNGNILLETSKKSESGFASSNLFYSPDLEKLMFDEINQMSNICCLSNFLVKEVKHLESMVLVIATSPNNNAVRFRAKYLLACDGANSIVRKQLGVLVKDYGYSKTHLKVDLQVDKPIGNNHRDWIVKYCLPRNESFVFLNATGSHSRWEFSLNKKEKNEGTLNEDVVINKVRKVANIESPIVLHNKLYKFKSVIAKKWKIGNIFLLGDSAHQMAPYIGQGMCAGIRDSANLCWKLDLIMSKKSKEDLLTSYEYERLPHVRFFLLLTILTGGLFNGKLMYPLIWSKYLLPKRLRNIRIKPLRIKMRGKKYIPSLAGRLLPQKSASEDAVMIDDLLDWRFGMIGSSKHLRNDLAKKLEGCKVTYLYMDIISKRIYSDGNRVVYVEAHSKLLAWFARFGLSILIIRPDKYIWDGSTEKHNTNLVNRFLSEFYSHSANMNATDF